MLSPMASMCHPIRRWIVELFTSVTDNVSVQSDMKFGWCVMFVRCRFPSRSVWLIRIAASRVEISKRFAQTYFQGKLLFVFGVWMNEWRHNFKLAWNQSRINCRFIGSHVLYRQLCSIAIVLWCWSVWLKCDFCFLQNIFQWLKLKQIDANLLC